MFLVLLYNEGLILENPPQLIQVEKIPTISCMRRLYFYDFGESHSLACLPASLSDNRELLSAFYGALAGTLPAQIDNV